MFVALHWPHLLSLLAKKSKSQRLNNKWGNQSDRAMTVPPKEMRAVIERLQQKAGALV